MNALGNFGDYSGGLDPAQEQVLVDPPAIPSWCENMMFTPYDPKTRIGMWLHLGSLPEAPEFWEDRVIMSLPDGEGVLSMWATHKTPLERRPGGSNMSFRCIEPFRRWRVEFDGFVQHVSNETMLSTLEQPVGRRKRLTIELDIEHITPAWDVAAAAHAEAGRGSMADQGWAKEHYEQLYRATGRVTWGEREWPFDGFGWRDHSRGPRVHDPRNPWGGHSTAGLAFPSGKAVIFTRMWTTSGRITLEGAQVTSADGTTAPARLIEPPRLTGLVGADEHMMARLEAGGQPIILSMASDTILQLSMQNQVAVGTDLSGSGLMYVINFGVAEWDGETGLFYIERSEHLSRPLLSVSP